MPLLCPSPGDTPDNTCQEEMCCSMDFNRCLCTLEHYTFPKGGDTAVGSLRNHCHSCMRGAPLSPAVSLAFRPTLLLLCPDVPPWPRCTPCRRCSLLVLTAEPELQEALRGHELHKLVEEREGRAGAAIPSALDTVVLSRKQYWDWLRRRHFSSPQPI